MISFSDFTNIQFLETFYKLSNFPLFFFSGQWTFITYVDKQRGEKVRNPQNVVNVVIVVYECPGPYSTRIKIFVTLRNTYVVREPLFRSHRSPETPNCRLWHNRVRSLGPPPPWTPPLSHHMFKIYATRSVQSSFLRTISCHHSFTSLRDL